jgi:DNA-binding response OmpR family regulator
MAMKKKNVLVCDDNAKMRSGLKMILEDHFNLSLLDDGNQILDVVQKDNIELVLLDNNLKTTTGLDLIKGIKLKYPLVRIIILTAYRDDDLRPKAMAIGADELFVKPFNSLELIGAIQKLLS